MVELLRLLVGVLVWLLAAGLVAAAGGAIVGLVRRERPTRFLVTVAVIGGLIAAGLAARLDLEGPLTFALAARPVDPLALTAGGAGAVAVAGRLRGVGTPRNRVRSVKTP